MNNFFKSIFSFIIESLTGLPTDGTFYEKILDLAFGRVYEVLSRVAYALSGGVLLITGFLVAYFNILTQYDRLGVFTVGAVAVGGIVLIFIGFGIIYNKTKKEFTTPIKPIQVNHPQAPAPIEIAIASLVQEYIKEREFLREKEREQMKTQSTQTDKSLNEDFYAH